MLRRSSGDAASARNTICAILRLGVRPVAKSNKKTSGSRILLTKGISVQEFDEAYFYADELKQFAREIGIVAGNFRKLELEDQIREYLQTGRVSERRSVPNRRTGAPRDELAADRPVQNYVDDKSTKAFLLDLVATQDPDVRPKSGQWYWLNDWRRSQLASGTRITYGDLACRLLELMRTNGRLPQIPSARMNNFITDFLQDPINRNVPRKDIMREWERLKAHPGPKTYAEYRKLIGRK